MESSLGEVLEERDSTEVLLSPTGFIASGAVLDSLGLVTLIIGAGDCLVSEHGIALGLADNRAMSQERSPC